MRSILKTTTWSGGGAPTLLLATPNIGSAAGGWTVTLSGTNFIIGNTAVSIGGRPATNVVVTSASTLTCKAPAFSTSNGSATGQPIAVMTPSGVTRSSSTKSQYFYLPSNGTIMMAHRADVGITLVNGSVSSIADLSGNGRSWPQATANKRPPAPSGAFSTSGLPFIAFNGSTQLMQFSDTTFPASNTLFVVGSFPSPTTVNYMINVQGGGAAGNLAIISVSNHFDANYGLSAFIVTNSNDAGPHTFTLQYNGTTSVIGWVDAVSASVAPASGFLTPSQGASLGAIFGSVAFGQVNWACDLLYSGSISAGDISTVQSILKQTCGTP